MVLGYLAQNPNNGKLFYMPTAFFTCQLFLFCSFKDISVQSYPYPIINCDVYLEKCPHLSDGCLATTVLFWARVINIKKCSLNTSAEILPTSLLMCVHLFVCASPLMCVCVCLCVCHLCVLPVEEENQRYTVNTFQLLFSVQ